MTTTYADRHQFETFLEEDFDAGHETIVVRDANDRPWIIYVGDGEYPYAISYPRESDSLPGAIEAQEKYLGNLDLLVYPVRVVSEQVRAGS